MHSRPPSMQIHGHLGNVNQKCWTSSSSTATFNFLLGALKILLHPHSWRFNLWQRPNFNFRFSLKGTFFSIFLSSLNVHWEIFFLYCLFVCYDAYILSCFYCSHWLRNKSCSRVYVFAPRKRTKYPWYLVFGTKTPASPQGSFSVLPHKKRCRFSQMAMPSTWS